MLVRGPGVLQIGLDQEPAVVLVDVPPGLERVLDLLDGCHHQRDLHRAAAALGIPGAALQWALRTLDSAGLLVEGLAPTPPGPRLRDQQVRLIGAGRLGHAVATLLVPSGVDLCLVDGDPTDPTLYPAAGALGTQAEALRASLAEPGSSRTRVVNHWSKPDDVTPDLTIVASEVLECDRVVIDGLVRTDQPHLVVRPRAGGVVVGPLVLPGRTPCVRCTDLSRRDADPVWPTMLSQLQRTTMAVTAALAGWAGAVVAAQALAFLGGCTPETCGATLEICPVDYVTHRRSWAMHPACGCGWRATAQ